jgi:hypothetical protein
MCDQEPDQQRSDQGEPDHLRAVEERDDSVEAPRSMTDHVAVELHDRAEAQGNDGGGREQPPYAESDPGGR